MRLFLIIFILFLGFSSVCEYLKKIEMNLEMIVDKVGAYEKTD